MQADEDVENEWKLDQNITNCFIDVKKSILYPLQRKASAVSITHGTETEADEAIHEIVQRFHHENRFSVQHDEEDASPGPIPDRRRESTDPLHNLRHNLLEQDEENQLTRSQAETEWRRKRNKAGLLEDDQ